MIEKITVDVCIPTYQPGPEFEALLRGLASQRFLPDRIFVANTDRTRWKSKFDRLLQELFPGQYQVIHIEKAEFDHGTVRDRLARMGEGDRILFMTQDAEPFDDELIENLLKAFSADDVRAAYARQLPREDCSFLERYTRRFNYPEESRIKRASDLPKLGIKTFFCSNVCAMYDRKTYLERGGFARPSIFNEDMIYAAGLIEDGYAVAYAADARVIHSHNYSSRQQFRRNFDLGVSQADHPEIFEKYPSEGEGLRLVKSTAAYAVRKGRPWLVFPLFCQTAAKYAGYRKGKGYQKLSKEKIMKWTSCPSYFERSKRSKSSFE